MRIFARTVCTLCFFQMLDNIIYQDYTQKNEFDKYESRKNEGESKRYEIQRGAGIKVAAPIHKKYKKSCDLTTNVTNLDRCRDNGKSNRINQMKRKYAQLGLDGSRKEL